MAERMNEMFAPGDVRASPAPGVLSTVQEHQRSPRG
ncbi:hypothetical protein Ae168Ps1_2887c [Pseudonocardia sp. Ae168_Ps1]|nr:hypothetical protein Ae150APs1_2879c [Pseudonocardia sp. Ae150A_Ps1]OLL80481.1 hypothetical protein Ae168Ps1_2887c [Pseudonocardia sp. Ae168_Ps1]OLL85392.1 hypothetical protein Ae263Ps1_2447 [Pseudonocardia sp. Ae263_Ps1]OLL94581.1 hypothetical protein Ae356Ps1_4478c [Pseudonocardia sp. Ae356_Ps1]